MVESLADLPVLLPFGLVFGVVDDLACAAGLERRDQQGRAVDDQRASEGWADLPQEPVGVAAVGQPHGRFPRIPFAGFGGESAAPEFVERGRRAGVGTGQGDEVARVLLRGAAVEDGDGPFSLEHACGPVQVEGVAGVGAAEVVQPFEVCLVSTFAHSSSLARSAVAFPFGGDVGGLVGPAVSVGALGRGVARHRYDVTEIGCVFLAQAVTS